MPNSGVSPTPTGYAVFCHLLRSEGKRGAATRVYLTPEEYDRQMNDPDSTWICPHCWGSAEWDDETYEAYIEKLSEKHDGR